MSKKKRRICRSKNRPELTKVEAWGSFGPSNLTPEEEAWAKWYLGIPEGMPETVLDDLEPEER